MGLGCHECPRNVTIISERTWLIWLDSAFPKPLEPRAVTPVNPPRPRRSRSLFRGTRCITQDRSRRVLRTRSQQRLHRTDSDLCVRASPSVQPSLEGRGSRKGVNRADVLGDHLILGGHLRGCLRSGVQKRPIACPNTELTNHRAGL